MFFNGSRYLKVGQYTTTDAQGRTVNVKQSRPLLEVTGTFTYTVVAGDRLDLLAIHRDINKCEIIRWNKGA